MDGQQFKIELEVPILGGRRSERIQPWRGSDLESRRVRLFAFIPQGVALGEAASELLLPGRAMNLANKAVFDSTACSSWPLTAILCSIFSAQNAKNRDSMPLPIQK
ncbi:MAG: hypothetical protein WDN46_23750 [Methylocella sp.]